MSRIVDFPDLQAIEQEAAEWLIKMDGDDGLSNEDRDRFNEWVNQSPAHREQLTALAEHWDNLNVLTDLAVPLEQAGERAPVQASAGWRLMLAAAAMIALAAVGIAYFSDMDNAIMESNGFYATAIGEQRPATLADDSIVLMNTNTQIKVAFSSEYRDVHLLQGEAHFTVAENPDIPFRVFAGTGRIEAVGTAFSVRLKDDKIDVTVTEGRVALAAISPRPREALDPSAPPGNGAVAEVTPIQELGTLHAGQIGSIPSDISDDTGVSASLADVATIATQDLSKRMAWTEGVLVFSGEPLEQVVNEISRYTTVTIEFSDEDVRTIRIGGRFPVGETDVMFDSLETNFGLHVTHLTENRVLVSAGAD